jgi:hypothetical protein
LIAADAPQTENDSQSALRIPQIVRRVKRKKRFFAKNFQIYLFLPNSPRPPPSTDVWNSILPSKPLKPSRSRAFPDFKSVKTAKTTKPEER